MRLVVFTCLIGLVATAGAQQLTLRNNTEQAEPAPATTQPPGATVRLEVPSGSILKLALDKEVRLRRVGQPVEGKLIEPVYAFDKLVIPAGTEVTGKVASIESIHTKKRVMSALDADLSPYRKVSVRFESLSLPDGHTVQVQTATSTGALGTLQFVSAPDRNKTAAEAAKGVAAKQVAELRAQAKQEWNYAMHELRDPGKVHRLERYALNELPYRPEYLDKGTAYDVQLTSPMNFGDETVAAQDLTAIGTPPPAAVVAHAMLETPLSSATAKKDDAVRAVVTQPIKVDGRLYVPEGSVLVGKVLEVRPAGKLARNGQLRIGFSELRPPNGAAEQIEGALEAFATTQPEGLTLDSEGGATVHPSNMRYLTTGLSVAVAAATAVGDREDRLQGGGTDSGPSAASGLSGFKAVGMIAGAVSKSRVVGSALGFYGAGLSVWTHFLSRGRDVIYPHGMSMIVALGTHDAPAASAAN